jgi:hypothetical protein
VHYTDSNGPSYSRQEAYEERVVTYRGLEEFNYRRMEGVSGRLTPVILEFQTVRVDFDKYWECGDDATHESYIAQRRDFISRNENRDVYFNFWEKMTIAGFKEHVLGVVDPEKKGCGLSLALYLLVGFCFCMCREEGLWPQPCLVFACGVLFLCCVLQVLVGPCFGVCSI